VARKAKNKRRKRHAKERGRLTRARWAPVPADSPFIDETLQFWQPRANRTLTREDGREIIQNVLAFLSILDEWDRAERAVTAEAAPLASAEAAENPAG